MIYVIFTKGTIEVHGLCGSRRELPIKFGAVLGMLCSVLSPRHESPQCSGSGQSAEAVYEVS